MCEVKVLLPRSIKSNRGDLASRWFFLKALAFARWVVPIVFSQFEEDIPKIHGKRYAYGKFRNAVPIWASWNDIRKARYVFWAVGLDMQDDSSLTKLVYLWLVFSFYRLLGKKVWCLFQGAGPLETPIGRFLAQQVLKKVDVFVARDPKTERLIRSLSPGMQVVLAHDAIFFEEETSSLDAVPEKEAQFLDALFSYSKPVIAFNLRQWFHFSSSILPYEFAQHRYQARSARKMQTLVEQAVKTVQFLRTRYNARVVLVSAYQPGLEPWEDDLQWLRMVKANFLHDTEVVLIERWLSMPAYFKLMAGFTLTVGMRLHTTLISLRFGVPSINLNYTIKGKAILQHLGLGEDVVDLDVFLYDETILLQKVDAILSDLPRHREKVRKVVQEAIEQNENTLMRMLERIQSNEEI